MLTMVSFGPVSRFCVGLAMIGVIITLPPTAIMKLSGWKIRGPLLSGDEVADAPVTRAGRWLAYLLVPTAGLAGLGGAAFILGI